MVIKTRSAGSANGAVPGDLRRHNRGLLLDLLSRHGAMSRKDIAAQTRLTAAAISRIPRGRLLGVGVAIAGVVDPARAVVLHSPNIGWDGVALGESLARATRLPVVVEAMHHALNLAEVRHGAMRGIADAVLVNAAMGIGASVMEEGRIVRGSHGAAGQIGHMRITRASEICTCGRRGCLDTVASGYAVLRRLGAVAARRKAGEHGTDYAQSLLAATGRERAGERTARAAFRACGEQLGEALNAVRAVFDPARIVLAGPLSQTGSYVEGVRARLGAEPQVFLATHSTDAAAANLALLHLAFGPRLDLSRLCA